MNKKLRRLLAICCMIFICLSTVNVPTVKAAEEDTSDDSLPFVEVIEEMPTQPSLSRAAKTKSATKTVYCNDSNGNTLWSLRIVATFSYTGSSSKCTSAKAGVSSNSSYWKVSVSSCTRSGNKATATAVGKKYSSKGVLLQTVNKSVTISCSANGTIS